MKKIFYIAFLILGFSIIGERLLGQELLQVVEKKISSSIPYIDGEELEIVGEKAEIMIEVHSKSTIEYEVKVISKNTDKALAEKDLLKMKVLEDKVGKTHFLRNYIEIKNPSQKPTSSLKVVYTIKVPSSCAIKVKNYFGKIAVVGLANKLSINSEFTPISLRSIDGKVRIESTYGDINAQSMSGNLSIKNNRAKISVNDFIGDMDIEAILAEMHLESIEVASSLHIKAERSSLDLSILNDEKCVYQYELEKVDWKNSQGLILKNEKGKVVVEEVKNKDKAKVELIMDTGSLKVKTVNTGQVYE